MAAARGTRHRFARPHSYRVARSRSPCRARLPACPRGTSVVCCLQVSKARCLVVAATMSWVRQARQRALMHRLRRSIRPALLLAFAWLFGVATPLHCIVHCHLHPFLLSTAASDPRQHVCHLDIGVAAEQQLTGSRISLPSVVQLLITNSPLAWIVIPDGHDAVAAAQPSPLRRDAPPPTPPPRS